MVINAVCYLGVIGLWMKEKRANMVGFVVVAVLEALTLIFGIYVAASFDSFKILKSIGLLENTAIMSIYIECFVRVGLFVLLSICQYFKYSKME